MKFKPNKKNMNKNKKELAFQKKKKKNMEFKQLKPMPNFIILQKK